MGTLRVRHAFWRLHAFLPGQPTLTGLAIFKPCALIDPILDNVRRGAP